MLTFALLWLKAHGLLGCNHALTAPALRRLTDADWDHPQSGNANNELGRGTDRLVLGKYLRRSGASLAST